MQFGESFWPYTVNDGFLALSARYSRFTYCSVFDNAVSSDGFYWGKCNPSFEYPSIDADFSEIRNSWNLFR